MQRNESSEQKWVVPQKEMEMKVGGGGGCNLGRGHRAYLRLFGEQRRRMTILALSEGRGRRQRCGGDDDDAGMLRLKGHHNIASNYSASPGATMKTGECVNSIRMELPTDNGHYLTLILVPVMNK